MPSNFCRKCGTPNADDALFCQKCGEQIEPKSIDEKPKAKKYATLKTGSLVNLIGGIGFIAMVAILIAVGNSPEVQESASHPDFTISPGTYSLGMLFIAANACLVIVTILAAVTLIVKTPKRKTAIALSSTMLGLTTVAIAIDFATWNFAICCGMWLVFWGTAVQLVGSIICMKGAFKLNE